MKVKCVNCGHLNPTNIDGIATCIVCCRKTLGLSSEQPSFIATGNERKPFDEEYAMSQDMMLHFTATELDENTDLITAVMFLEYAE